MNKKTKESFYIPILRALKEIGGEGKRREVISRITREQKLTDKEMGETTSKGTPLIENQISWARWDLITLGYLRPRGQSKYGIWALSEMGQRVDPEAIDYKDIVSTNKPVVADGAPTQTASQEKSELGDLPDEDKHREELLAKLRGLTPFQFEHICKRLLSKIGLVDVEITKRTRDGGLDGWGYLEINPMVKTKIVFECKRLKDGSVGVDAVRGLQAAIESRKEGDRGVIITTSSFSSDAVGEAKLGKTSIELINGDALVDLFVEYELGVKTVYAVDDAWFLQFANETGK